MVRKESSASAGSGTDPFDVDCATGALANFGSFSKSRTFWRDVDEHLNKSSSRMTDLIILPESAFQPLLFLPTSFSLVS